MNKLLIISYNFPPDNAPAAQRPASFLRYCRTETIVLTCIGTISALGSNKVDEFENDDRVFRYGSVTILKSGMAQGVSGSTKTSLKRRIFNEIKIPDKSIVWYRSALKAGQKIIDTNKDITHLFSSSPSVVNHMVARKLARRNGLKWIADFRDYYYIETIENENYLVRPIIDRHIERSILKDANHITFISEWMRKEYSARYPMIQNKSTAIYNGFDSNEFKGGKRRLPSKLTIFYAGTFYDGLRSPIPLFRSLDRLSRAGLIDLDDIIVEVAGRMDILLQKQLDAFQSSRCFNFLGLLPRTEILSKYKSCHVLWLIIGDQLNHYSGFPIKGYEYMGSKRPLLLYTPLPSEGGNIIKETGNGYIVDTRKLNGSDSVLLQIYEDYKSGSLDEECNLTNSDKYTRQYQAKQLDKLIDEIR